MLHTKETEISFSMMGGRGEGTSRKQGGGVAVLLLLHAKESWILPCNMRINSFLIFSIFIPDPNTSKNPADWTVVLGDHHRVKQEDKFEQRRNVISITVHENYKSMFFEGIEDTPPMNDISKLQIYGEGSVKSITE